MSLYKLNDIVTKAAKAIYDNEKFSVDMLAVKANRLAQQFPMDQTVVGISNFLKRRAEGDALFITRAELKDVYNKLYRSNNKFAEHFVEELALPKKTALNKMKRDPNEGKDFVSESFEKLADPLLSNALQSAFDTDTPLKRYSAVVAKRAQKTCLHELNKTGIHPKKIDVVAGQSDVLICQATYDTPRGQSYALIPVEVVDDRALIPTMFLSKAGFVSISKDDLKEHLLSTAGKSYKVDVQKLLGVIAEAKNGTPEPMSEVERIVMMAEAAKETPSNHTVNGILYQEVDKLTASVKDIEIEQPEEVKEIAARLSSHAGAAEFLLGKKAVDRGRNIIRFLMGKFGHRNCQVSVSDNNSDTIFYSVSIDSSTGFKVPVKVKNGEVVEPTVVLANGNILDFSEEGISTLLAQGVNDTRELAKASPLYKLKPSDLIDQVRVAMLDNDYLKAEDALNVLRHSGDKAAFDTAFKAYRDGLGGKSSNDVPVTKCAATFKHKHSKHLICSHTNLPVHKVYQDKNGDCHPLYRKKMSETAEGGSFLHSRIYMG
jgi:hypothetical protein